MHFKFSATILLLLSFFSLSSFAQNDTGKVEIIQDYKIKELQAKHIEVNAKSPIEGYRIKIHFGSDKTKAKEIKVKFMSKFPGIPAYEKYDQPNFNIRVGDFRTKLEAYKALKEIQPEFPSSFIVQDEIEFPELNTPESKK
ncbi:MAG: SPOR domain-containing protein [Bacteroidia bacterium]|nr:SPOR domain-containing protein [Bacteroidia bacterium]